MIPCTLRLTDGEVQLRRNGRGSRLQRRVQLPQFLQAFNAERDVTVPLLPEGTKVYRRVEEMEVIVTEDPPRLRTLRWEDGGKSGKWKVRQLTLAFPYVVYFWKRERGELPRYGSRLFFRVRPLTSDADTLCLPTLTHVQGLSGGSPAGAFCIGEPEGETGSNTIAEALAVFWNTTFDPGRFRGGQGLWWSWSGGMKQAAEADRRLKTLGAWERASERNPRFVLDVAWPSACLTVREVLDQMLPLPAQRRTTVADLADLVMQCPEGR